VIQLPPQGSPIELALNVIAVLIALVAIGLLLTHLIFGLWS
jgi:hypothetical protein